MAGQVFNFPEVYDYEAEHPLLYFNGQIMAGSLMIGSSISYPMLSKNLVSVWAPISLAIFFPSWIVFNLLQISRVLKYGHYTVVVGFAGLVLTVAFGRATLSEHALFIPVYSMAASLLTFVWPSLGESWANFQGQGYHRLPLEDMSVPQHGPRQSSYSAMEGVHVDSSSNDGQTGPPMTFRQALPRDNLSSWLQTQAAPGRLNGETPPLPSLEDDDVSEDQRNQTPHELQHMGPVSTRSDVSGPHSDTSIALSSRESMPSELSANVAELLQTGPSRFTPRQTQRRLAINELPLRHTSTDGDAASTAQSTGGTNSL